MKKYEKGEVAEIVLGVMLASGFIAFAIAMPNAVQIFKYFNTKSSIDRLRIKRSVYRLEKAGLVIRKGTKEEVFSLTQKGREKAMRYALGKMKVAEQKTWDRKWRLVMFDIPEEKMQTRRAINFALKKLGFLQYQKSIFVTPFPCEKEIGFVCESFGVRNYIRIVVAVEIEKSEALKKAFGI